MKMQQEENVYEEASADPVPTPVETPKQEAVESKTERGPDQQIMVVTNLGFGTRTTLSEFRIAHRGTKGNKTMTLNEKNGHIIGVKKVGPGDVMFLITKNGQGAVLSVDDVSVKARGRFGVRLMKVDEGDAVVAIA